MQDFSGERTLQPGEPGPLVRHARVGLNVAILGLLVFCLLAWNVLAHGPLVPVDQTLIANIHIWARQTPPYVVSLMRRGSDVGYWGVALVTVGFGLLWLAQRAWRELALLLGVAGAEILFQVLSTVIGRPRPHFPDPFEGLTIAGFPSGHTVTSTALACVLLYIFLPQIARPAWRVVLALAALLLVAWVMFSRLFLGSHFPTDVLAGAALGIAWAALVATAVDRYVVHRRSSAAAQVARVDE